MINKLKKLIKKNIIIYDFFKKSSKFIQNHKYQLTDIYDSYLSKATAIKKTPYGFNLTGSTSQHHKAMQNGNFEPDEVELFKKIFSTSDIFVDVGANIGFYGCLAKSSGKHVIAIEPLPRNLEYLLANVRSNNWDDFEIYPVGLSEQPGQAILYGASSTGASLIGSWAGSSKRFKRTIVLSTLDSIIGNRFNDKKLFIKIDVEGMEYSVLLGGMETASRNIKPTWVLEICLNEFHPDGINPNFLKTFEFFWNLGYQARTADKTARIITPNDINRYISEGKCDTGSINYIFSVS